MLRHCCKKNGEDQQNNRLCSAGQSLLAGLNEAGSEAEWLSSLLEVLVDHLDQIGQRLDPTRSAKVAADVGRIARDWSERLSGKMADAEEKAALPG
jgi:hypothetical protein